MGCAWQDVVPVQNATTAIAAVLRSLKLRSGDYIIITSLTYPAVRGCSHTHQHAPL
jgi:dTDP-4-amino-4,6-dideoxygalactose transaminase